ncbi:MAG: hypothetical protein EP338_00975 [Bacteroidetes bacterium]|nr:MAG: hypothetical protein EP338_00975 [Bacteroidota bacterium]
MKKILFLCLLICSGVKAQGLEQLKLSNALIVAQQDKAEDRFTMEVNLAEIFANSGIKTMASLNFLKEGSEMTSLAKDSLQQLIKSKGVDTYVLVSVRGYDRRFKEAEMHGDLKTELSVGHLYPVYREGIASITFEFLFFRDGAFVAYDQLKLGGIGSRESVLKKLRRKLPKRIKKKWK